MRVRLLALLSTAFLFLLGAAPAQAEGGQGNRGESSSYLALGDSVPFGFNPLVTNQKDVDAFVGYPEIVARSLDLRDVNATCPGEATGGFLSLTGTDNVCRPYRFVLKNPLHAHYRTSQMAFATRYLHAHEGETRLVTLTLGANDFFRFQKDHPECFATSPPAACAALTQAVFATMQANLNTIFANIRAAGYSGLIVGVTYYAINYGDPVSVAGSLALNQQMIIAAAAHGVLIADGFTAWAQLAATAGGDSCAAGLLIRLSSTTCDVHPTPAGRDLLAAAVVKTVAASCPAHSAEECLERNRD
jgi:lysophospholipase L1-like esterase